MKLEKNKIYFTASSFIYPKFVINSIEFNIKETLKELTKNKSNLRILDKVNEVVNS